MLIEWNSKSKQLESADIAEKGIINDIIARTVWHIIRPMACRRFHWNKNLKKFDIKVLDEKQWLRQNIVLGGWGQKGAEPATGEHFSPNIA